MALLVAVAAGILAFRKESVGAMQTMIIAGVGATLLLDYGFPEGEYYHEQRHMGNVMCHRAHQADSEPLLDVGHKDITAHVNFTGIAVAACGNGIVTEADLEQGSLYTALPRIREVSAHIGTAVANTAFKNGLADRQQPEDVFADVQSQMYNPRYRSYV